MLFTSFAFLLFFVVVLVLRYALPRRLTWAVVLVSSLVFYGWQRPIHLIYLLLPGLFSFFLAPLLERIRRPLERRLVLGAACLLSSLGLLIFKFAPLTESTARWLIPLGISFYTFRILSYLFDVYRGQIKAESHIGRYLAFVTFFPQLLSGPIERAGHLLPQLETGASLDWQRFCDGGKRVVWGLFKKMVIADRLGLLVNLVFRDVNAQTPPVLMMAAMAYSMQIYADFSGYSDMAIGLGRMLGFETPENFKSPYHSRGIGEFWQRWHISLSNWLRDYLFLPLAYGLSRRIRPERLLGIRADSWSYSAGILVTMLFCGLWHGAGWSMLVWGAYHGLWLTLSHLSRRTRRRLVRFIGLDRASVLHRRLQRLFTWVLITLGWVFFRAETVSDAFTVLSRLYTGFIQFWGHLLGSLIFSLNLDPLGKMGAHAGWTSYETFFLVAACLVLLWVDGLDKEESIWLTLQKKPVWLRFSVYYGLVMWLLLSSYWYGGTFIYFKF